MATFDSEEVFHVSPTEGEVLRVRLAVNPPPREAFCREAHTGRATASVKDYVASGRESLYKCLVHGWRLLHQVRLLEVGRAAGTSLSSDDLPAFATNFAGWLLASSRKDVAHFARILNAHGWIAQLNEAAIPQDERMVD